MTTLEKMARAMAEFERRELDPPMDVAWPIERRWWMVFARTALMAIREPDDAMIEAAHLADPLGCDVQCAADVYPPSWRAQIDAILNEKPEGGA